MGAAYEAVRDLAAVGSAGADTDAQVSLWAGFLALYGRRDAEFVVLSDRFAQLCGDHAEPGRHGPAVAALAVDLRSRAQAMRYALAGKGGGRRTSVMAQMTEAAAAYQTTDMPREALAALRRAASFGVVGRAAERATARELLVRARDQARAHGLAVAEAEAGLALAECALRDVLDGRSAVPDEQVLAEFDRLVEQFADAGHAFGEAKIGSVVAQLLLAYGLPAGVEMARTAAQGFADADAPVFEQPIWAALNAWYTAHGDPAATSQARMRESELARAIGFGVALEVRALDEANQAFRAGDVAVARPLLDGRSRSSAGLLAASRVMAATSANAVGMKAEARELLEGVVAELTDAEANLVLGEALSILATLLTGEDDERAARLLAQAAAVAEEEEAFGEQARYLAQAAWGRVVRRYASQSEPLLDEQARGDFERAERLLLAQRTLSARGELVTLYQYRGQAAFFAADWDECGTWLTRAENLARSLDLVPHLAAILCHQGLALISVGRRSGPQSYDYAAERFTQSRQLYEDAGLIPFVWRVLFFLALCDIEAARWPHSPDASPSVEQRLERAGLFLEAASEAIDRLRRSSENGTPDRRQQVWMAFSLDKQTFYEQAFQLAWDVRRDEYAAWLWLERAKGRALLDALGDAEADGTAPPVAADTALRREAAARSAPMGFEETRALLAAEQARSGRGIVLAQYLNTPTRTLMFIARSDRDRPEVLPVPIDHATLRGFATSTFRAPGGVRMMEQDLADGGAAAWHRFAPLIAPLAQHSQPGDVIYLAPHGILHDLPLHTLPLDGMPLIERNPVCYVPTAAVLRHTLGADGGSSHGRPAAVFGDPRGNLPSARDEAAGVAGLLGVEPVIGADADRVRVLRALAESSIVHIASHGRISTSDGFDSYVELAGRDTLQAADLLPLRSSARLVVLSGCETGVSEQRPGEELVGFTRTLLLSGVPSILSSQWRVSDASTRELLYRFHQAAADPARPLADALREAILSVRAAPGYAHLYHWGSFVLVGSWR